MSDARLTSLGEGKGPIVLQGAMEMEVAPFIKRLKGAELEVYGDFFFWRGTFGTRPLIISQTGIGTAAAGAATALACALYQPSLIVNQGTAGGYGDLAVGDVVLASALYNANARYLGRDGLRFMELGSLEHESVAAMDFPDVPPLLETDERLRYILEAFLKKSGASYRTGIIASSDQWNEASEQIRRIREKTGALCEEMEAAAVWMTAKRFRVSCAFVRIISNNNERGLSFDPSVCETLYRLLKNFFM